MRALICLVSFVMLTGSIRQAAAQEVEGKATTVLNIANTTAPDRAAVDQMIDRIIAREHYEYAFLTYLHPILETHIQEERRHGEEEVLWRQWDLQGRASITADLSVHSTLKKNPDVGYEHVGFLQEAFVDRTDFDRSHYSFRYVGQEDFEGIHCVVFDIVPLGPSIGGRFQGRIWANNTDYTIIRFTGTYMPMHHWELVPTPVRSTLTFANFDSRRSSEAPGIWLPSTVFSQRSNLSEGHTHWDFNSETRFFGYSAAEIQNPKIPAYSQQTFQKPVPVPRRLGKNFWIPWAVNFGLMMTANALTAHCLAAHQCQEGDPILGKHPSAGEIYGLRLSTFALGFALARRSKLEGNSTLWHYGTYLPMMLYAVDTFHDVTDTVIHSGDRPSVPVSVSARRQVARARLMNDLPLQQEFEADLVCVIAGAHFKEGSLDVHPADEKTEAAPRPHVSTVPFGLGTDTNVGAAR